MSRILFITCACLILGSCQVNELIEIDDINEIYVEIENDIESKTSLDTDHNIRWSEGDLILAFMHSSLGQKYQIKSDYVGRTSGFFKKVSSISSDGLDDGIEWNHNVVFYPYMDDVHVENSGNEYALAINLPEEQKYSEGSFGSGAMPMIAVSEDNSISFKNVCGGIKLKLKGTQKITLVKVEGKNNEKLSGSATVIGYAGNAIPEIKMSSDASTAVRLDCSNGVQLSERTSTEFIIILPPIHFSKGLIVELTDEDANQYVIETDIANTVKRSSLLVMPTILLGASGPEFPEDDDPEMIHGHNPEPYFSEPVELMGLIWRLAGAEEYNDCNVATIANSADKYFASMMDHPAVKMAKGFWTQGIRYDAVTGYANQLIFNEAGDFIFDPDYLEGSNPGFDSRWNDQQKNDMLNALNDFYRTSNFHEWFISTEPEQQQAVAAFKSVVDMDYAWLESFYGKNDKITSRIILSFMIGGNNNGISLTRKDGTFLLTPVYGCLNQRAGSITFSGDMNLVVHEFSHPYCNPLIEANWSAISAKAEEVYQKVRRDMERQAYGSPGTMMCETLVRSCAIHYMVTHITHNQEYWVDERIKFEESCGFMMVRALVKTLEKREKEIDKYPTLEDFMPEIIDAINKFHQDGSADPDTLPHDYVDLGIEMADGRKLYFATRNVGESSPAGIDSNNYNWGSTISWGEGWFPASSNSEWPAGHRLDAAHDIATIEWGGDWHVPSPEEWDLLAVGCDYERKEADESGYGVAGYFFYNKSDHDKFIFLPVSTYDKELKYWSSEIKGSSGTYSDAYYFSTRNGTAGCYGWAGTGSTGFSVRPVISASGAFDANGHEYVDLGLEMSDGTKLYFATMNVGETTPGGRESNIYRWGATKSRGDQWIKYGGWPTGKKLDAVHDIATITWGEEWHIPSREEWNLLVEKCDFERKEANETGYDVAGYFFYNKSDRTKFIFLPVSSSNNELKYWSSEISEPIDYECAAYVFESSGSSVNCNWSAAIQSNGYAIRPVFVK